MNNQEVNINLNKAIIAERNRQRAIPAVTPPEPELIPAAEKILYEPPQSDGHCFYCGRTLGSWIHVKNRLIQLRPVMVSTPQNSGKVIVCKPCSSWGYGVAAESVDVMREYLAARWLESSPIELQRWTWEPSE